MSKLLIPQCLVTMRDVHAYDYAGAFRKAQLHRVGRAFLRSLVSDLGLVPGTFEIRISKGGIAVSGEVTLHAQSLYVQLFESCTRPGISVMYRTCNGTKDYTGGTNHFTSMAALAGCADARERFVMQCKVMAMGNYSFTVIGGK